MLSERPLVSDAVVRVRDLGKEYRLGSRKGSYKTIRETLSGAARWPSTLAKRIVSGRVRPETFWALRDVDFDVSAGEVVGIIGRNGAGKSTLLKILARITEPSLGEVQIRGRVRPLLEVGTGFHPELTGRENIFMNGAILGMRRSEILSRFDEIVAFAEVEQFVDTAVKHYSSGMYLRLAFAVAAHLEPEILIVDEILAVGDEAFQRKCLGKMGDVGRAGRTVLFVSHNLQAVNTLCTRTILLDRGRIAATGATADVVATYVASGREAAGGENKEWNEPNGAPGNLRIRVRAVRVVPEDVDPSHGISMEAPLRIEIEYWNLVPDTAVDVEVELFTTEGQAVLETHTSDEPDWQPTLFAGGLFRSVCRIPGNLLNRGDYRVRVLFLDTSPAKLFDYPWAAVFTVQDLTARRIAWYGRFKGVIHPLLHWSTELLSTGDAFERPAGDRDPGETSSGQSR